MSFPEFCIYHVFVWSNFSSLHNSQWITLPIQSSLVLYSLYENLLHSFIMWLIVLSLSPYNLHLLFCCVFSIFPFIQFVLMTLFWAAIRRDSVSLLRPLFFSHIQLFSCEVLPLCRMPFWFSGYFCWSDACIVCIISGGCNQSSSAFFTIVFESLYRCIDVIFSAGESSASFFSWNIQPVYFISELEVLMHEFSCSLLYSFKFFPSLLQE